MSDEPLPQSDLILYQTEDGRTLIQCRFENETVWLTQQHMAELFQTTKQNIGQHLKSIFTEGELVQDSVVKESFTTAADGKNYATRFYNLDAIISVGYRVKSAVVKCEYMMRNESGVAPAHADFMRFFDFTPPSVNSMLIRLQSRGFIRRIPHKARAIELTVNPKLIPPLDRPFKYRRRNRLAWLKPSR